MIRNPPERGRPAEQKKLPRKSGLQARTNMNKKKKNTDRILYQELVKTKQKSNPQNKRRKYSDKEKKRRPFLLKRREHGAVFPKREHVGSRSPKGGNEAGGTTEGVIKNQIARRPKRHRT